MYFVIDYAISLILSLLSICGNCSNKLHLFSYTLYFRSSSQFVRIDATFLERMVINDMLI